MRNDSPKAVGLFALLILGLCLTGMAKAQVPFDTVTVNWVAPTQCSTGEPVSACPVTGYRVESAASASGVFATVGSTPATASSFVQTGQSVGVHCFRVFSQSALGESVASNVACKTVTKPVGPPNPPLITVADLAMTVKKTAHGYDLANLVGIVKLGAECDPLQSFGNGGYYAVKDVKANVTFYPWRRATRIAARCA